MNHVKIITIIEIHKDYYVLFIYLKSVSEVKSYIMQSLLELQVMIILLWIHQRMSYYFSVDKQIKKKKKSIYDVST